MKRRLINKWAPIALLFTITVNITVSTADVAKPTSTVPIFQDGTRCAFIGDSITQGGRYFSDIELYYLTRFPDRTMEFYNCGISGDTSGGAVRRYEFDIASKKPNVAAIMFGMNDVNRDLYDPTKGPADPSKKQAALDSFKTNMHSLTSKLKASGISMIIITPSPYDDTSTMQDPNRPGVNNALGECTTLDRALAVEMGAPLVDFHDQMTTLSASLKAHDPVASLNGQNRVHPGPPGHLLMAYLFLKAQGVPAQVARFSLRAKDGSIAESNRCVIDQVNTSNNALSFRYVAQSIPFPIDPKAADAEKWIPITQDLNQEIMQIVDLPDGKYELDIDGGKIQTFNSDELAKGVNLAEIPSTPERKQADKLLQNYMERFNYLQSLRKLSFIECYSTAVTLPYPVTLEQMRTLHQQDEDRLKGNPAGLAQLEARFKEYSENKQHEQEWQTKVDALTLELRNDAKPKPHFFEIKPAQ